MAGTETLLIGTYTESMPHADGQGEGILGAELDGGKVGPPSLLAPLRNPAFLTLSADRTRLYAVTEARDHEGAPGGSVSAFARDPGSGALTLLGTVASGGSQPCHLLLDPDDRHLLVANYWDGSLAVFAVEDDGSIGAQTGAAHHEGKGPNEVRQENSHPHQWARIPGDGRYLVPDLGNDVLYTYELGADGGLSEVEAARLELAPGAGPRHVDFHPNGRDLFLLNELDSTVVSLRRDGAGFAVRATVSTLPEGFAGESTAGAIRVAPSGRHLFVSNRGPDSDTIAILAFVADGGELTLLSAVPSGGGVPRDIELSPDGRYLLVANQDGENITAFAVDEPGPTLTAVASTPAPTPVCLVFV